MSIPPRELNNALLKGYILERSGLRARAADAYDGVLSGRIKYCDYPEQLERAVKYFMRDSVMEVVIPLLAKDPEAKARYAEAMEWEGFSITGKGSFPAMYKVLYFSATGEMPSDEETNTQVEVFNQYRESALDSASNYF